MTTLPPDDGAAPQLRAGRAGVDQGPRPGCGVQLRRGRSGEVAEVAAVHREAWATMIRGPLPEYQVPDLEAGGWPARWAKALAAPPTPRQGVAVLEDAGALVGVAWLGPFKNRGPGVETRAVLSRLYVLPGRQGEGLGSRLLAWAEAHAAEGGARTLELWCLDVNQAAQDFYRARGYVPDGGTGVYRRDGLQLTNLRLRKRLGT